MVSFATMHAQVGIGTTTPDASSILELKSTKAGLLLPRVALTSTTDNTTVPNPATSLLVYNTTNSGAITPGYYYWDTAWKKISSDKDGWSLNGNTLSTGAEFLGSTNYFPLILKSNNTQVARFHPNGGFTIGFGAVSNNDRSIAIGNNASASSNVDALALGNSATASGYRAVAVGYESSATQNDVVAVGYRASTTGIYGTAIGYNVQVSGQNATAIGSDSKASGYLSSSLGNNASASGSWSTAIGYGATSTQDNAIVLGNSVNAQNRVGIGTNTPDERLHVVGSIKMVDGNQAAGKVMTSDANGKSSWTDLNSQKVYAEIDKSSNQTFSSGGAIDFGTNAFQQGVTLATTTIQVNKAGIYRVTYNVTVRKNSGGAKIFPEFYLHIWGTAIANTRATVTLTANQVETISFTKLISLNAFDGIGVGTTLTDTNTEVLANNTSLVLELIK